MMEILIFLTIVVFLATFAVGFKLYKKAASPIDLVVKDYVESRRNPRIFKIMETFTRLANVETIFLLTVIFTLLAILKENNIAATSIVLASVLSSICSHGLKLLFRRSRPIKRKELNYVGYSFPSGHSTIGVCFYTVLAYLITVEYSLGPGLVILGLALGLAVALSRIYLSAHWALDVFFGICLGLVCASWVIHLNMTGLDLVSPVLARLNLFQ